MAISFATVQRYRCRSWATVCESSTGLPREFARLLRESSRPLQIAYQRLMASYGGQPVGVECRVEERDSWAFVLPDACGDKPWRIQQFDPDGFVGHLCLGELDEAVEEMLRMGYQIPDPGALDRVASTSRWSLGVRRAAIMQRHQEGLVTYRQMVDELSAIAI
jgi:hypothetical protein